MSDYGTRALITRVARSMLPGEEPVECFGVGERLWDSFLRSLCGQQLEGVAAAAVDANIIRLEENQRVQLFDRLRDSMVWGLTVERRLLTIAELFDSSGIEFLVLKGPALAHGAYPDPSWRPFRDLDILVRSRDWELASAALAKVGFARDRPEPRPGFDLRFGKAAVHTDAAGIPIDLHHRLVLGPFGHWIDPEALFRTSTHLELGGRLIRRPDDTWLVLHACVHAVLGWRPPLLLALRDVAQTAWLSRVDWPELEKQSRATRLDAVVQFAFRTVRSRDFLAELPAESLVFERKSPQRRQRRALESFVTERRSLGGTTLATMAGIRGPRARLAYARMLVFPSRDFMAWRGKNGGSRSYLQRWILPFSWLRGRIGPKTGPQKLFVQTSSDAPGGRRKLAALTRGESDD